MLGGSGGRGGRLGRTIRADRHRRQRRLDLCRPDARLAGFVADTGLQAIHTGQGWFHGGSTLGATGAGLAHGMAEGEVTVGAGTVFDTGVALSLIHI